MNQETTDAPRSPSLPKTSLILYAAFFLAWCAGAVVGVALPDAPALLGMPLWFVLGCLLSFAGVSAALIHRVRAWLK